MKKIIILRREDYGVGSATGRFLISELKKKGVHEYIDAFYEDVIFSLEGPEVKLYLYKKQEDTIFDIKISDLVYLRGFSNNDTRNCIAHFCADNHIDILNTENKLTSPTSKLAQYYAFALNGVPYPNSIAVYPKNVAFAVKRFNIKYPFILKSAETRGGNDNYLITDEAYLMNVLQNLNNDSIFIIQKYIKNNGDYRVITFNNEVLLVYMRESNGNSHVNNVAKGARRVLIDKISDDMRDIALGASKALNREISGVDIIMDKNGSLYVLEVNFNFGISQEDDGIQNIIVNKLSDAFDCFVNK